MSDKQKTIGTSQQQIKRRFERRKIENGRKWLEIEQTTRGRKKWRDVGKTRIVTQLLHLTVEKQIQPNRT